MNVVIDICVVPMGVGVSVSEYVVECQRIFEAENLSHERHADANQAEVEWNKGRGAVRQCYEKMPARGAPRVTTSMRIGTRIDREQTMSDKLDSVYEKMQL